jgi:hypothetical protein
MTDGASRVAATSRWRLGRSVFPAGKGGPNRADGEENDARQWVEIREKSRIFAPAPRGLLGSLWEIG